MTPGAPVLVPHLGKEGLYLGDYGERRIVRFPGGRQEVFDADQVVPIDPRPAPRNLKLAAPPAEQETDIQAAAIAELTRAGYIVLQCSVRYHAQRCRECGAWARPEGGTGQSPGIPDLIVTRESWPIGLWRGVEMKGPKTPLSAEQELLLAQGRISAVRTAAEARECADAATAGFVIAGFEAPVLDQEAIAAARARVEKKKIERAHRLAQRRKR